MTSTILFKLALIGGLGIFCQWIAWRTRLPAILFLLLTGILVGPTTGLINPDQIFGNLLFPMISLAVSVILFEGSLTLRFHEIAGLEKIVQRMVTSGLLVTWTVTTLATYYFLHFKIGMAILFGALTVVTGPTVILPMIRSVRPSRHIANILRWEGIVIDPIGALLAVLVFEILIASHTGTSAVWLSMFNFIWQVFIGSVLGIIGGHVMGLAIRRQWIPTYLHSLATLAFVTFIFALSNAFTSESGLLTVTVMGIWVANMKDIDISDILDFKESLSMMFISVLFIILAARLDFSQVQVLGWASLGVLMTMQLLARPLKILVSTWGSSLRWQERLLLSWIAPRGIVAAAVAAIFAIEMQKVGYPQAELLVPLTFIIIIGTVLLQSTTARFIAQGLGVAEPYPTGFLILGANTLGCKIAAALQQQEFPILVADNNWENLRNAVMQNLPTYYGDINSEHADQHMDLSGIGQLLALSPSAEQNVLSTVRYRSEFGKEHVFLVRTEFNINGKPVKKSMALQHERFAFSEKASYEYLNDMLRAGADIHATSLTKEFDFNSYYNMYFRRAVFLFALDTRKRLYVYTTQYQPEPQPGWTMISLIIPANEPTEPVTEKTYVS